jgi:hypothetical protein
MSFLNTLKDIVTAPVKMLCSWAEEPLRHSEHRRQEQSKDMDVKRDIERQVGVEKALSEQRIREKQLEAQLDMDRQRFLSEQKMREDEFATEMRIKQETEVVNLEIERQRFLSEQKMRENAFATEMKIKRETEIVRIITEIEQFKKDKEFERMKAVSDAMMLYQKELTRINVEAVEAIGSMRIDLQRKAYELIHEKTQQYAELQEKAILQAEEQLARIDNSPNMSESSRAILTKAVDNKLAGVINNATRFIEQLNDDMQLISKDINLITSSGQQFIERHLQQFQLIGFSGETTPLLNNSEQELLPFNEIA